jgi:NAD(P)H-quinone oxidoreductase subunit 5
MVVSLGMIHLLANAIDVRPTPFVIGRTVALATLVAGVYFTLQLGFEHLVGGSLPRRQALHGVFELLIVVSMVISFGAVTVFQNLLPGAGVPPRWEGFYAHVSNGLYVNTLANRWVLWFWPTPPPAPRTATPSWMPRHTGVIA